MRDHPRACGAHINVTLRSDAAEGSSPRMRGSPVMVLCMQLLTGIIPAHAGLTPAWRTFSAMIRDHPRACGAHLAFSRLQHMTAGSSPRMRGSLVSIGDACVDVGIIPAHAGLTYTVRHCSIRCRDHPRACGAHGRLASLPPSRRGSSPRMRGSPSILPALPAAAGIIPAHAGLTCHPECIRKRPWDHPRACGAHQVQDLIPFAPLGSSPRMRGSLLEPFATLARLGIIPAHAGLTL